MPFLAARVQGKNPQSQAFVNKKLDGFTQGRLGDIQAFSKAENPQLAYAGYKESIEAFLFATAVGRKVNVTAGHFPIPEEYHTTVPLPLPPVVFRLAQKPSAEQHKKLMEKLKSEDIMEIALGKGNPAFKISKPSLPTLVKVLPRIAEQNTGQVEGCAQVGAMANMFQVYQCIDLFLRVNTYYHRADDTGKNADEISDDTISSIMEPRQTAMYHREGYADVNKSKKQKISADIGLKLGSEETTDLTPGHGYYASAEDLVLIAKPSRKPASVSYGHPNEAPNHPGLVFPYFDGMLAPDSKHMRAAIAQLFFRNLGSSKVDPRDAYKELRSNIGSFANTSAGIIIGHILQGIVMALESQTHLYLLFDGTTYLGFNLFGEKFACFVSGTWYASLSDVLVRSELTLLRTNASTLSELKDRLAQCNNLSGDAVIVEDADINSPVKLANVLSSLKISGDEEEEISTILSQLTLKTSYKTFSPANICAAIKMLTIESSVPFDVSTPIHIPLRGWSRIGTREYQVFASFGPRGFSFRNSKGTELRVPKKDEEDPMTRKDIKGNLVHDCLVIGEKPVNVCMDDWAAVVRDGSIKMEFGERAKKDRCRVFKFDQMEMIWTTLKDVAEKDCIRKGVVAAVDTSSTKRKAAEAFGGSSIDDVF